MREHFRERRESPRPYGTRKTSLVAVPGFRPPRRTPSGAIFASSLREEFSCCRRLMGGMDWARKESVLPCSLVAAREQAWERRILYVRGLLWQALFERPGCRRPGMGRRANDCK